eukprot:SAG25_NODE_114_length_14860_cov_13.403672_17_plen_688_part_00
MEKPCENYDCIPAMLGVYWKARCKSVFDGSSFSTCIASASSNTSARFDCEKEASKRETACAHLGLAGLRSVSFLPDDNKAWHDRPLTPAEKCTADATSPGLKTVAQARRCGTHPQLAWETLSYVQGAQIANAVGLLGDNRCSAVTFVSMVKSQMAAGYCSDSNAYNYDPQPQTNDVSNNDLCIYDVKCSGDVLNTAYGAISNSASGSIASQPAGTAVGGSCGDGFSVGGSGSHYCSLSPYVIADEPQFDPNNVTLVFGEWNDGFTCDPMSCNTTSGTALAPHVCSSATCDTGFTCEGKVNGDVCGDVECVRGYTVNKTASVPEVFTCAYDAAQGLMDFSIPSGCIPDKCLIDASLAGRGYTGGQDLKTGETSDPVCTSGGVAVGTFTCMSTKLIQGGSCTDNACSGVTSPSITTNPGFLVGHSQQSTDDKVLAAASTNPLAASAWDNDPTTWWMSMIQDVNTATGLSPQKSDWLSLEVGSNLVGVRPCSYSIQLGKYENCPNGICQISDAWEVSLVRPTAWTLEAGASATSLAPIDTQSSFATTGWKAPCNQAKNDLNCGPTLFNISTVKAVPYKYFKITFTADDTAASIQAGKVRGQVIVQDIHLMEAYGTLNAGTAQERTARTLAGGTLMDCPDEATTTTTPTTTFAQCKALAPNSFGYNFDTNVCRYPVATGTNAANDNTVCYA